MKRYNDLKYEDASIKASDNLKESIWLMQKGSRKIILKGSLKTVVGLLMAVFLLVNLVPSHAHVRAETSQLASEIRVITFGIYEKRINGYSIKVITPQIVGLANKDLEKKLNDELRENANALIMDYENFLKEMEEKYGGEIFAMGTESDYIILTDNEKILAFNVYVLYMSGSSAREETYYNLDKESGELLTLKGLFKEGADYVSVISSYIKEEMVRRNKEGDIWFEIAGEDEVIGGFEQIKEDQNFYINDEGEIVICFGKYEVAAGAFGCPEFIIPTALLENIIKN